MAGSLEEWARYERWNEAIAQVVYPGEVAGLPVYLDLEDHVVEAAKLLAEPDSADAVHDLVQAVKGTLLFRAGLTSVLDGHLARLDRWQNGSMLDPPPSLALLAMLSLVAEHMRQSDDMKAHNFYGRLAELADLDVEQLRRFEHSYRHRRLDEPVSAELWYSLNDWLEMHEGARGLPTVFPVGHEHVGLPLSQALVRQADRDKFIDLFAVQGLAAGSFLPVSEMETHIDEWMARVPCPASNTLERLWKENPTTRAPIAEVAVLELEQWDGRLPEGITRQRVGHAFDEVRVKCAVRTFPSRRFDLSLVVPGRPSLEVECVDVLDANGNTCGQIDMVPCASGWIGAGSDTVFDGESFLSGNVRLKRAGHQQLLLRRPRRLIPLRRDELLQGYVECERIQLGEESMVLCQAVVAEQVTSFLELAARPGFTVTRHLTGLPEGWVLFEGIQIMGALPRDSAQLVDLNVLQPLTRSQVVLQGGLRLPGHLRKWLSARPPELRTFSDGAERLEARLSCTRPLSFPKPPDSVRTAPGTALIWDFADEHLPDGDFRITVEADGQTIGTELLRLRSADSPARQDTTAGNSLGRDPATGLFPFSAVRGGTTETFTCVPDGGEDIRESECPAIPNWWSARAGGRGAARATTIIRFPQDGASCIKSGAHHMDLPIATGGQTAIQGVCRYCGLQKRYPTKFRTSRKKPQLEPPTRPSFAESNVPPVRVEGGVDWALAFDAVCHVGSGPMSALKRITDQMEATDLFGDAFARTLENLGHIEIERSPLTLAPVSWQTNGPVIVGLDSGDFAMVGFRCERATVAVEDEVWKAGGEIEVKAAENAPPTLRITGVDHESVEHLTAAIELATSMATRFVPHAALRLASILPPLSESSRHLPTTTTLSGRSVEAWDPATARFRPTVDAGGTGAYRVNGFTPAYVFRRSEDLGAMRGQLGDARIVKYLAAREFGTTLIGYDSESEILYVPLGADLPGLYGRAAALSSARPPVVNMDEHILEYRQVPPALVAQLNHLLMS